MPAPTSQVRRATVAERTALRPARAVEPPRTPPDDDTFIIGRSRTCDLVIPSSKVSRQHSGICRENGEYYIEDLGSANGVWRDGVKIQKEKIKDGDEFMISEEVLKFIFR